MITFTLHNVIAEGPAVVTDTTTTQVCTVVTKINNLVIGEKLLTDLVTFVTDSTLSINDAWASIQSQAATWVQENYVEQLA